MKTTERAGRFFLALLGGAGLLLLMFFRTGISVDVVLSGSMEPAIRTGGLVFTDNRRREPEIGDIITYSINGERITHRVVRKKGTTLITKGDANKGEDLTPVNAEQVLGTVIFTIPFAGYLAAFMKQRTIFAILILIIVQELIFTFQNELTERKTRYESRQKKKT